MADKNVSINISATDNASTPIRTVSRSLEQMRNDVVAAVRPVELLQNALAAAGITIFVKQVVEASLALEKFGAQYKAIFGTSQSANELKAVSDMANRLGLELKSTGEAYGKFAAAARGSSLEGQQARKIFEGLSVGMTALKLGPEEAGRAFAQLQQMMSKGKVQMEEVRTLSESLPGAMQMIADSMGLTTAQLSQQMEKGTVLASDVLPKLAAQMRLTYGKAAEEAANQGQAAINKFKNEILLTASAIGDKLMPALADLSSKGVVHLKEFRDVLNDPSWDRFLKFASGFMTGGTDRFLNPKNIKREYVSPNAALEQLDRDEQLRDDAYRGIYEARRNALRAAREKAAAVKKPEIHDSNVTASDPALEALKELTKQIISTTPGIDKHTRAIDLMQEKYGELAEKSGAVEVALGKVWINLDNQDALVESMDRYKQSVKDATEADQKHADAIERYKAPLSALQALYSAQGESYKATELQIRIEQFDRENIDETTRSLLEKADALKLLKAAQSDSNALSSITNQTEDMQISMMIDPYAQEMASMEARYSRERELIEQKIALVAEGSDMEKALYKQMNVLAVKRYKDEEKFLSDRTALGGMRNAIYDYTQSASNMGDQIKNTFTSAFKSMEDSMVNFITKGKFDFKSMADSIIADIVRIQVKQMLSGALNSSGINSLLGIKSATPAATPNSTGTGTSTATGGAAVSTVSAAAGAMLVAVGVVMSLSSALSATAEKIRSLKTALSDLADTVADKTLRLQGNVTEADYLKAQQDQMKARQEVVDKYDELIKKRNSWQSSFSDMIHGTGDSQERDTKQWEKDKIAAMDDLLKMQDLELQGIKKKIEASTVPLKLKELELKGLEYTAEYTYLLNIQREAELVGLDKVNQATQQRIWILEDAAKKEAKLSELTKNLEAAQERYDKAFGLDLQSQADALRDSANTLKGVIDMQIDAQSSLLSAFREIKYGDLAQLSPQAAYENAKSAFATADAKDLPAAAKALMTASKAYNATGKAFFDDQKMVLERIGTEAGISADTSLDALNTQISQLIMIKNEIAGGNKDQALQLSTLSVNIDNWRVTNNNAINTLAAATRAATTREQTAASAGLTSAQGALNSFNNPAPYSPPSTTQTLTGQVSLFKDDYYLGDSKKLGIGEYPNPDAMGFGNDWLSSIKIPAGYVVTLFNDDNYQGISTVLQAGEYRNANEMGFPNDFLSSIKITKAPGYATGTPFVPSDMLANIHQGEIIMDRASSDVLRKYGIPARGSADNRGVEERLDRLIENGKNLDRRLSNIEQKARLVANA